MTEKADTLIMVQHNVQLSQLATRRLTGVAAVMATIYALNQQRAAG